MGASRRSIREVRSALYMLRRNEVGAILYLLLLLAATLLVRFVLSIACLSLHASLFVLDRCVVFEAAGLPISRCLNG